jgi:hypothetical protein
VFSVLSNGQATELAAALLGENATVITDLPKAKLRHGFVEAGGIDRHASSDPADVLNHAKELLAIHKVLVEQQAVAAKEAEVAKAKAEAKESELTKRRDALAAEFRGWGTYGNSSETFQKAIDRIIELEEAAK